MDLFSNLNDLSLAMSKLPMYPLFDTAHYIVSVMSLKEQPGALEVARRSPFACWFSSMLYCFGGAVLSSALLAEPPVVPLSNNSQVLLASIVWYLVFYCPRDLVYRCSAVQPVRLVLSGMKEVTRTGKVLGGVAQAQRKYKNGLLVMIAVGWAKGAGGGLISNFEQLVRGVWKPETNELLKMSYPTKITLIGAVLFSLQKKELLPIQEHHLMFLYTVFLVVTKVRMMLTGSSSSPFAPVETVMYRWLFTTQLTDLASESKIPARRPLDSCADVVKGIKEASGSVNGSAANGAKGNVPETVGKGLTKPAATGDGGQTGERSKKTD